MKKRVSREYEVVIYEEKIYNDTNDDSDTDSGPKEVYIKSKNLFELIKKDLEFEFTGSSYIYDITDITREYLLNDGNVILKMEYTCDVNLDEYDTDIFEGWVDSIGEGTIDYKNKTYGILHINTIKYTEEVLQENK